MSSYISTSIPVIPELADDTNIHELNKKQFDDNYPDIVHAVMTYIIERKQTNPNTALIELISDYCFKNSVPIELIGDAIASDVYFKSFIESDCEHHNIIRSEKKKLDEW